MMKCNKVGLFCGFGVGPILLLGGALVGGFWAVIFEDLLSSQLILSRTSRSYDLWRETPLPMYFDIYMFNWTNPEETLNQGQKPNFSEVGPYVFSEHHSKVNVHWNDNGTVTFQQIRKWIFQPHLSNGSLNDYVTNINVIAMTIGSMIKKKVDKEYLPFINVIIKHEESKLYVTKKVGELLFDGYDDKFLQLATKLKPYIHIDLPFDKFGWFYNRNNSKDYDGVFNMYTGSNSFSQLGNLFAWNYRTKTPFFQDECSHVTGTTGELWPPRSTDGEDLKVFSSDICSVVSLNRSIQVTKNNLVGRKYVGLIDAFDNGTINPQKKCYCVRKPCQPSGTRDISSCRYGAPAFVSYAHFYLADPEYLKNVSGLQPSKELHEFYMILHEETAIPLSVQGRLQVNILTEPIKGLKFFEALPTAYLPQMWFNQRAEISQDMSSQLGTLVIFHHVGVPLFFTVCAVGFLLLAFGVYLTYRRKQEESKVLLLDIAS